MVKSVEKGEQFLKVKKLKKKFKKAEKSEKLKKLKITIKEKNSKKLKGG